MFKRAGSGGNNQFKNLPAPVQGLDTVSGLMNMSPSRTVLLENWFCKPNGLETRDGYVDHVTGFAQPIDRLHTYAATNGGETLWATTATGIYDASTSGAVGAAAMALTNGFTISTAIATGANNYMMVVNGVDNLKRYDGAAWLDVPVLGAVNTNTFSYVETYRQRLFFATRNSLDIAYLAPNSIAGAPTAYPLGALFRQGGFIVALGTWTIDGGTGPEDNLAVITNKGEVAVFAGNDPATWNLKGVYFVGRPLGSLCFYKYGGDLLIITETGLYPLSSAVQSTSIDRSKAVTQDVKGIFTAAAKSFPTADGWQIIADPLAPFLLVNIPSSPIRRQAVMHSQTGAWTLYSGWDARAFARKTREMYFGTSTKVCRITGTSDAGANIVSTMLQAYSRLGYDNNKKIELAKAYFTTNGGFSYNLGAASDFSDPRELTHLTGAANLTAAIWGTSLFGTGVWTGITAAEQDWQTIPDDWSAWKGFYLQVISNNARVFYAGSDLIYKLGSHF